MKSPFPGMDPYMERRWLGVHGSLITFAQMQLNERLPDALRARANERVLIEAEDASPRNRYPDVHVVEYPEPHVSTFNEESSVAVAEPVLIHIPDDPIHQRFLEILDASSGYAVVTLIEFISPTNKARGDGSDEYRQKRSEALASSSNVVEIDLTRRGSRDLIWPVDWIPRDKDAAYQILVRRAARPSPMEYYPAPLQKPLPTIKIPLRADDPDVHLELQTLVDQVYRAGRYDDADYSQDPDPPLEGDDAAWADQLLTSAGFRG